MRRRLIYKRYCVQVNCEIKWQLFTGSLPGWLAARYPMQEIADITPEVWFAYLDERQDQGIKAATINSEFSHLRRLLCFLEERGHPICTRLLRVEYLDSPRLIPKNVPPV